MLFIDCTNYTASYIYSLHYTLQSIDYSPHVGIHVASRVPHMQQVMLTSNNIVMTDLHPNCWLQTIGRVALMEQGNVNKSKNHNPQMEQHSLM